MLPLSANPDFKSYDAKIEDPFRDLNGDGMIDEIEIYGTNALDQAIEAVIVTEPYERLFNVNFWSPFYRLLFQNENSVDEIMTQVYDTIEQYVGVTILRAKCDVQVDSHNHTVSFKLPYTYNHGMEVHTFARHISA